MSSTLKLLQQYAGGGFESDFFKFEDGKTSTLRFYRFVIVDDAGSSHVELCAPHRVHFHGKGKAPTDCPGEEVCEQCKKAALYVGSGTPDDRKKARDMQATTQSMFTVIDLNNPTKFFVMEAGFGLVQKILLKIAEAGGWVADYPEAKDPPDTWLAFENAVNKGVNKVTGPTGRDIIITYNKGKGAKTYNLVMRMDENKTLPFPEDNTVLSPIAVRQKMTAAGDSKEGDD